MSPKMGRPTAEKKSERLEIRLTPSELAVLEECAVRLDSTKTEVINKGVKMVKSELDKKE